MFSVDIKFRITSVKMNISCTKFPNKPGVCLEAAVCGQFYILTVTKTDRWKNESLNSGIECVYVCVC